LAVKRAVKDVRLQHFMVIVHAIDRCLS